jgi:hypothetical protein
LRRKLVSWLPDLPPVFAPAALRWPLSAIRSFAADIIYFHFSISAAWSHLWTTTSLTTLPALLYYPTLLYNAMHGDWLVPSSKNLLSPWPPPNFIAFVFICHHALATLLGLLGSLLAQYLYATQPREKPTANNC